MKYLSESDWYSNTYEAPRRDWVLRGEPIRELTDEEKRAKYPEDYCPCGAYNFDCDCKCREE